ncbi:plasmid segregation protein ParM domain-containing protein [Neptunomonas phycophila]|uniref:plasmid segregation protein ParM domain-containing protein n=1 Tax=Neptunomonas phycophila TaxID=1572645 RepID=UPI0035146357
MNNPKSKNYFKNIVMEQYLMQIGQVFDTEFAMPVVAIDDGYAQCNWAFFDVEEKNGVLELEMIEGNIPSLGRRGRHTSGMAGGAVNLYGCPATGEEYTISPWVPSPEDTRSKDYPTTDLNRFLVHAVLDHLGLAGQNVIVVTGLPLQQFMDGENNTNTVLLNKKRENLMKSCHIGTARKPAAKVAYTVTYPEAVSGMVDYLIDDYGNMNPSLKPDVIRLGLDIGGNTTDLAIVLPGNQIGAFKTLELGVKHIKDKLRQLLIQRFDYEPDPQMLEEALLKKEVSWFGSDPEDVSPEVADAISFVMTPILSEIDSFKKDFPSLREIVGFGGGVALMHSSIRERYPNIIIIENADGANARGFLKYGLIYDLPAIMGSAMEHVNGTVD